jgi:hypothetical protein
VPGFFLNPFSVFGVQGPSLGWFRSIPYVPGRVSVLIPLFGSVLIFCCFLFQRTVRVTINDEAREGLLSAVAGCLHTHWTNRRGVPLSVALQSLPEAITKKNSNGKDSKGK